MRLYELAKRLGVPSRAVVGALGRLEIPAHTASSNVPVEALPELWDELDVRDLGMIADVFFVAAGEHAEAGRETALRSLLAEVNDPPTRRRVRRLRAAAQALETAADPNPSPDDLARAAVLRLFAGDLEGTERAARTALDVDGGHSGAQLIVEALDRAPERSDTLRVRHSLRRGGSAASENSARFGLEKLRFVSRRLGMSLDDWSGIDCLDVGCGHLFAEGIARYGIRFRRYVGIDVNEELMQALTEQTRDAALSFHHLDVGHDIYNPRGARPDPRNFSFPVGDAAFDIVLAVSLFTHLDQPDLELNLREMRAHIRADGRLFATVFLDEEADGVRFVWPDRPLLQVAYAPSRLRELAASQGWEIEEIGATYKPEELETFAALNRPGFSLTPQGGPEQSFFIAQPV